MRMPITRPLSDGQIFKRQTIIDAAYALTTLGHSGFDRVLLEIGMDIPAGKRPSLDDRANALAQQVFQTPAVPTPIGQRLDVALVIYAGRLLESSSFSRERVLAKAPRFKEQLQSEGITVTDAKDEDGMLKADSSIGFSDPGLGSFNTGTFNSSVFGGSTPISQPVTFDDGTTFGDGTTFSDEVPFKEDDSAISPAVYQISSDSASPAETSHTLTAGTAIGFATVGGGAAVNINWAELAPPILTRLDEIDAALRELLPLARIVTASKPSGTIGHNNPPADFSLTTADLDEAQAATVALRQQLQNPNPTSASALRLGEKVLNRIGAIAAWIGEQGRVAAEEYLQAAAQQAGKRTVDAIYYLKMIAALAAAATATAALIHAIPI